MNDQNQPTNAKVREIPESWDLAGALAAEAAKPLSGPLCRLMHPEILRVDGDEPLIDIVASDETVDRYREVISASGWVLDNYRKNPVILNNHQYDDVTCTLGRADVTEVRDGRLYQRIRWAVEANPVAAIAYRLYRGGFLRAFSVGFNPIEWQDIDDPDSPCRRRFLKQELLEVSAVSIPANPNALALGVRSGAIPRQEFDALYDLVNALRTTHGDDPASSGSTAAAAGDGDAAAWLGALERAHRIMCGRA